MLFWLLQTIKPLQVLLRMFITAQGSNAGSRSQCWKTESASESLSRRNRVAVFPLWRHRVATLSLQAGKKTQLQWREAGVHVGFVSHGRIPNRLDRNRWCSTSCSVCRRVGHAAARQWTSRCHSLFLLGGEAEKDSVFCLGVFSCMCADKQAVFVCLVLAWLPA